MLFRTMKSTRLNILATLVFNLKAFPLREALVWPVLIYGKFHILSVGNIILTCKPSKGVVSIGRNVHCEKIRDNVWGNYGTVVISGRLIINNGLLLRNYGRCEFGDSVNLGSNAEIFCQEKIVWGNNVRTAANGFYMDTDGHFMFDLTKQKVSRMTRPIVIGNSVWLGNSVRIKKGTVIPDRTIVASFSLLGKDYSNEGNHLVIGGLPAAVLKRNILPILNLDEERLLKEMYFSGEKDESLTLSCYDEVYLTESDTNFF